jgi:hypothetical protein
MNFTWPFEFENNVKYSTMFDIVKEMKELLKKINGDIFYKIKVWPTWLRRIFWKKPLSDTETFKTFIFFAGNGCPPNVIIKWILSSFVWARTDGKLIDKRIRQLKYLLGNIATKGNIWFYYDLQNKRILHLNGNEKR